MIQAQNPKESADDGGPLIEAALVVEQFYAFETGARLIILGTGPGLTPLIMAGSPEQHNKFFRPFLDGTGTPMASLVFSELSGSPNFTEAGASGIHTVAKEDDDVYVINGEKVSTSGISSYRLLTLQDMGNK